MVTRGFGVIGGVSVVLAAGMFIGGVTLIIIGDGKRGPRPGRLR